MKNYALAEETLGYQTATNASNTDRRLLIAGSKNCLIDYQKKVMSRSGYTRLGAANTAATDVRSAWTWHTSTGLDLPQRLYDDELEVYLGTVDGTEINAWTRVKDGWSTTEKMRATTWWDTAEVSDLQLSVIGSNTIYEWNGAVAVVDSVTGTTVTKTGTTTFGENRFYATRNRTFTCVRTGTEYTYTGGFLTTTLTGIADTTGLVAGDILIQSVVTHAGIPVGVGTRNNDTIYTFENQICVGSNDDEEVYMSKNTDFTSFAFSSPRVPGEGALLTLEDDTRGIASLGKYLLIFSGPSSIFRADYQQLTVGSTLTETLRVKKFDVGVNRGALNQESIVPIGNALAYLTNEVALRMITNPEDLTGISPKTFSNPIKPDFDAEDWTDAFGIWYKNTLIYTAQASSRMYMLNFIEDADGNLLRFWNPPQTLPVGPLSIIDSGDGPLLHGHSNAVAETFLLFDGASDGQYTDMDPADKLPIEVVMAFAYNNFKERATLKTCDEYFVEGEITPSTTDVTLGLNYDFDGATEMIERTIDGSDEDILEGSIGFSSLAQESLALNPLGSLLNPPTDARKFRVIFDLAPEDFFELAATFSLNDVDKYVAIVSHGPNASRSRRRPLNIHK